ncbi:MAG: PKD domain-containing protein, partial [Candidatus Thermoplasmatota archaeon]|nr:PKD domain-containing protein [Candidatus Thermoplasmatota archaeon]
QTRVFVAICKIGNPPNDVTISIKGSLSGPDLTSTSIPKDQIPPYPGILWLEANYDDVEVIPQQSYYIVARTTGGDGSNYYLWYGSTGNPYPGGELWYSEDYGYWWGVIWDMDLCFETYGRDNLPPDAPTITGPNSGKPGISYDYTFNAMDLDGDDVRYIIDWNDTSFDTTAYVPFGTDVIVSHTWSAEGSYTITAKAEDEFGLIGPETTKTVTMPRDKALDSNFILLEWLFERFPNAFPILRFVLRL